jgi:hypothetical protein
MFQGRNFRLRLIDKDRYEFRSAYTQKAGTASEIQQVVAEQVTETQRNAIELALIKQKLKEAVGAHTTPAPTAQSPAPPAPAAPAVVPAPEPEAEPAPATEQVMRTLTPSRALARHTTTKRKRAPKNHVHAVDLNGAKQAKRRPSGLYYLNQLRAQEQLENAE